jgi:hypothetical protein
MAGGRLRPWALIGAGIFLALGIVGTRLLWDARSNLMAGDLAQSRGDRHAAIRHYQDAARLYLPGSPYVRRALDHLESLAVSATQAGDGPSLRAALEAERAAILAARWLVIPYASRLPALELRLAQVLAANEERSVAPGVSFEARTAWHLERLAHRPGPALPYVLLALVGLVLWVGSAIIFFRKGLDESLRLRRRQAVVTSIIFAAGLGMLLIGLRLA